VIVLSVSGNSLSITKILSFLTEDSNEDAKRISLSSFCFVQDGDKHLGKVNNEV
jgi:hypothetical protein